MPPSAKLFSRDSQPVTWDPDTLNMTGIPFVLTTEFSGDPAHNSPKLGAGRIDITSFQATLNNSIKVDLKILSDGMFLPFVLFNDNSLIDLCVVGHCLLDSR